MKEIKQVDPFSLAKVWGVLYAILGFIIGIFFAAFGTILQQFSGDESSAAISGMFGTMGLIFFPILYGVIGLLAGVIGGFLYNIICWLGGWHSHGIERLKRINRSNFFLRGYPIVSRNIRVPSSRLIFLTNLIGDRTFCHATYFSNCLLLFSALPLGKWAKCCERVNP